MKKILILAAVTVLLLSGCVDKKTTKTEPPQTEPMQSASQAQPQQSKEPQASEEPEQTTEPQASEGETGSTEETLQELGNLLEELKDDFADIDYNE